MLPTYYICEAPDTASDNHALRFTVRKPKRDDARRRDALPPWWKFEVNVTPLLNAALQIAFRILCLIALGHANLEDLWVICNSDEDSWLDIKDRLWNRINTITIVAGLLLGSTAAFLTTTPPTPDLFDYSARSSYRCILLSFGLTIGCLIVGSAMLFVMAKCQAEWFCKTMMGSRLRVCCTLIIIAYPFFCIGVSTTIFSFGFLLAGWHSHDPLLRTGCVFLLLVPCLMIPLFMYTQMRGLRHTWRTLVGTPVKNAVARLHSKLRWWLKPRGQAGTGALRSIPSRH
ncbi:hypothetical protein DENSPDRAFT_786865 [Dentipellis sp. KUC8613]|nr:hypothetical protein DENSPDRAFT_786865 [Dentipellis sp. KUC8613]